MYQYQNINISIYQYINVLYINVSIYVYLLYLYIYISIYIYIHIKEPFHLAARMLVPQEGAPIYLVVVVTAVMVVAVVVRAATAVASMYVCSGTVAVEVMRSDDKAYSWRPQSGDTSLNDAKETPLQCIAVYTALANIPLPPSSPLSPPLSPSLLPPPPPPPPPRLLRCSAVHGIE
jgi:hypothetical protein